MCACIALSWRDEGGIKANTRLIVVVHFEAFDAELPKRVLGLRVVF